MNKFDLLKSDQWASAIHPNLICDRNNEEDKKDRADGIVQLMFDKTLKQKKLLDFGCGEGFVCKSSFILSPSLVMGYDVEKYNWKEENNLFYTSNWDRVLEFQPYDFILLYDVLDHVENPIDVLNKIKRVSHNDTKIILRCHPWTSRHGGHLYHDLNKAFVHLFFSDNELMELGLKVNNCNKIKYPQDYYNKLFNQNGFKIMSYEQQNDSVEQIFLENEELKRILYEIWEENHVFAYYQMEQSFNDYILNINNLNNNNIVIKWNHFINGKFSSVQKFYSNGTINDPNSNMKWKVQGKTLTMEYPNPKAPNGVWVDVCEIAKNGHSYNGKNQLGANIYGEIVTTL